jgi:prepilin-type processing-associated H-X9-DG protein
LFLLLEYFIWRINCGSLGMVECYRWASLDNRTIVVRISLYSPGGYDKDAVDGRHPNKSINVTFADGHVESMTADEFLDGPQAKTYWYELGTSL